MVVSAAIQKMIGFYKGNLHDINHFLKVWAMAKTIGELEALDEHTQEVLELAAVIHDIACPLCREKYGNTSGKNQERESPPLVEAFFAELPVPRADVERISWLAAHHTHIRISAASSIRSCWKRIILSTQTSRAARARRSRTSADAYSVQPRARSCWTAYTCGRIDAGAARKPQMVWNPGLPPAS